MEAPIGQPGRRDRDLDSSPPIDTIDVLASLVITKPAQRGAHVLSLSVIAALTGVLVAVHYHRLGLTLSHYDARGHLVVARRIFDSITPGWQQIGAVWLPLPHLLNALPVQVDAWYQTGASAVAISVLAFAVAVAAVAWIVFQLTASRTAAAAGAAVLLSNPNLLYLQATPMTEPLLLGLLTLAVGALMAWCRHRDSPASATVGWLFALACLTRYEAWPVTTVALTAAFWIRLRQCQAPAAACADVLAIAWLPATAVAGFLIFSRVVIGQWFVATGFFVPENEALGHPFEALNQVVYGIHALSGPVVFWLGAAGAAALAVLGLARATWAPALVALSVAGSAALPWLAFVEGHPFRIRYLIPLLVVEAIGAGVIVGLASRARFVALALVLAAAVYDVRPLDPSAPMVVEAQWDRPNVAIRKHVTTCLGAPAANDKIMASMGSLGHYMQETSEAGFSLRDFLHEGNGDIWLAALAEGPGRFAGRVLIEEKAEGGDMLAIRAREDPRFLKGFVRVCAGAGLALYRRAEPTRDALGLPSSRTSMSR